MREEAIMPKADLYFLVIHSTACDETFVRNYLTLRFHTMNRRDDGRGTINLIGKMTFKLKFYDLRVFVKFRKKSIGRFSHGVCYMSTAIPHFFGFSFGRIFLCLMFHFGIYFGSQHCAEA